MKITIRMDLYQAMCGVIDASQDACNHPAVFDAAVVNKLKEAHKALRAVMAAAPIYETDPDEQLMMRLRELADERRRQLAFLCKSEARYEHDKYVRRMEEIEDEAFRLIGELR